MAALASAPWLGFALPMVLAALVAVLGRVSKPLVAWVAMLAPLTVLGVGIASLGAIPASAGEHAQPWTSSLAGSGGFLWFAVGQTAARAAGGLTIGWSVDTLSAVMLLVVGVVALMVMVFSIGYMHGDPGWTRYYALLCLFAGSMTLLVIGDSLATLFVGWELVGVCSYLLIGFWYQKPSAAAAAVKAFLTTRVGDVGLLIGIAILWSNTGTLRYTEIMRQLPQQTPGVVTAAAVCIAVGAIGKSAQFPLHIWLPDAMEGPTPVSALIHAATMVAAGVFLVARVWPLFEAAPAARTLLLVVGVISALGAALAAVAQRDIKKVLAYSTISQLGFMFAALGAGAWAVAIFHLVTHAAFKSLLFLTSGSVIHGAETQDMREMGGLRKEMPVTFVVWLIGVGALVGIWPLAGFFSKDLVIDVVWTAQPLAGAALLLAAFVTGLYSGRATRLTFFGDRRADGHAHESPATMLVPLAVLALPAAVAGFAGSWLFTRLSERPEALSIPMSATAMLLALGGVAVGWLIVGGERGDEALESRAGFLWTASASAFGYDALVYKVVVGPTVAVARGLWAFVDRWVIDGTVEGTAALAQWLSTSTSEVQNGDVQWYGAVIVLAIAVMLAMTVWLGR
ncbi:MAG TPA: NADH-quinone oxidoreductase subunit L [Coriobacteriia bacterium]